MSIADGANSCLVTVSRLTYSGNAALRECGKHSLSAVIGEKARVDDRLKPIVIPHEMCKVGSSDDKNVGIPLLVSNK